MIGQSGYLSPAGTKDNTQLVPYGGKQKCQTRRKLCHEWGGNVLQWRILSGYLSHTCYFWGFPAPSSLHWMRQFNMKANICNVKLSFRLHRILLFFFLGRHALTWTLTSNIWQLARALCINTAVHFLFWIRSRLELRGAEWTGRPSPSLYAALLSLNAVVWKSELSFSPVICSGSLPNIFNNASARLSTARVLQKLNLVIAWTLGLL